PESQPSKTAAEEASQHYRQGVDLYNDGNYKLGLIEFKKAYDLHPDYRVLYNIGQIYYQLNRFANSYDAFSRDLNEGGSNIPPERRTQVEPGIATLQGRIAYLSVESNIPKAEVRLDDEAVGVTPLRDLRVDFGEHNVTVAKEGYKPRTVRVTLSG